MEVAGATGRSIHTVRNDKESGRLDMDDLDSLADYIVGHRLVEDAKK